MNGVTIVIFFVIFQRSLKYWKRAINRIINNNKLIITTNKLGWGAARCVSNILFACLIASSSARNKFLKRTKWKFYASIDRLRSWIFIGGIMGLVVRSSLIGFTLFITGYGKFWTLVRLNTKPYLALVAGQTAHDL